MNLRSLGLGSLLVVLGLADASSSVAGAPASATKVKILSTDIEPEAAVEVSFEPLVGGVRANQRFWIAARFKIAPGYRIGWKARGEVGRSTMVTFRAPPGFDVGPTQYPAPQRFTDDGRGEWLGYENEVAIFAEVKAPSTVRKDDVIRLDLFTEYAACRDECRVAKSTACVELENDQVETRPHDVEIALQKFRARLPRPAAHLETSWVNTSRDATLVVKLRGATLTDFFSDGTADPAPLGIATDGGALAIHYDEAPGPGTRPLRGVIAGTLNSKDVFYDFEVKPQGLGVTEPAK